jgi:hypothetical protein
VLLLSEEEKQELRDNCEMLYHQNSRNSKTLYTKIPTNILTLVFIMI